MRQTHEPHANEAPIHGNRSDQWFREFANLTADKAGAPSSFALGVLVIVIWIASGPIFHFSDTWQLVINTGTTIITFLMVFLIQNIQTRDTRTMHLKLDELIIAVQGARNRLVDLEHSSEEKIEELDKEFTHIREAESAADGKPRSSPPSVDDAEQIRDQKNDQNRA